MEPDYSRCWLYRQVMFLRIKGMVFVGVIGSQRKTVNLGPHYKQTNKQLAVHLHSIASVAQVGKADFRSAHLFWQLAKKTSTQWPWLHCTCNILNFSRHWMKIWKHIVACQLLTVNQLWALAFPSKCLLPHSSALSSSLQGNGESVLISVVPSSPCRGSQIMNLTKERGGQRRTPLQHQC